MKIKLPFEIDLRTIAQASGGYLLGENIKISFLSTDTRKDVSDSIFIPIRGENFDGHSFISVALEKGAIASFSSEDFWEKNLKNNSHINKRNFILVKDTSDAFLKLAHYVRSKLKTFVIAVGGSVGKTTTKELIYFIFSELGFKAHKSAKSFNNNVGLAITILSMDKDSDLGVFEIGTSHKGEIRYLTKFADPDLGVITAIGKEHLEGLEDEQGVFEEEIDLIRYIVNKRGISVLNIGYRDLKQFFDSINGKKIGFYMMKDSEVCKNSIACKVENVDEFFNSIFRLSIDGLDGFVLMTNLPPHLGEVFAGSISSVIAYLKYERQTESFDDIFRVDFKKFKREKGRFDVKKHGKIFIIDDTYNSNPTSVEGMFFSASFQKGRKIFVIGDMLELGKFSEPEHENLGNLANKYFDRDEVFFLVYGDFAGHMFSGFQRNGFSAYLAKNRNDVVDELLRIVRDGDYVFFKASRKCKFEDILTEFSEKIF